MKYKVYYAKKLPYFDIDDDYTFIPGETHNLIRELEANSLGEVFRKMQGFNWSPNGEANALIRAAGVQHTSMSVGDVAVDEQGHAWGCASLGWKEIEPLTRRLLILGCTATKKSNADRMPAIERYDGPTFRVLRKALREEAVSNLEVYVLSAKYGLIEANTPIANYDLKMTPNRAMELRPDVADVLSSMPSFREVYIELGRSYLTALTSLPVDKNDGLYTEMELYELFKFYSLQWGKGGIGQRCAALKRWLRCCDHP